MTTIADTLAEMWREIAGLKSAMARTFTEGPVAAVDPARQKARIQVGTDAAGKPVLGPWVSYSQYGGAFKGHVPVSVGQPMTMIAPNGDWSRAALTPLSFSDANPSPSTSGEENVWTFGDVRIEVRGDEAVVQAPKVVVKSPDVSLGGTGGERVARVGDLVHVKSGSSAGMWPIVEGSSAVTAID